LRQDKIALAQTPYFVREDDHVDLSPGERQIRTVALFRGQFPHPIDKVEFEMPGIIRRAKAAPKRMRTWELVPRGLCELVQVLNPPATLEDKMMVAFHVTFKAGGGPALGHLP
jgi:hypothetical protein